MASAEKMMTPAEFRKAGKLLDYVNGKAHAHTVDVFNLRYACSDVEDRLKILGMRKRDMIGVAFTYVPEGPGHSYSRKARYVVTTRVTCERRPSGWRLVSAVKTTIDPTEHRSLQIKVTPEKKQEIAQKVFDAFGIVEIDPETID
jgi:hypothetical protein